MLRRGSQCRARVAAVAMASLVSTAPGLAQAPGSENPNDWPQYHRTSNGWRYSPLDQINKGNVDKLKVAWIAQGGDITSGIQETPIVVDGIVYSITAWDRVSALDGKTGRLSMDHINYGRGRLLFTIEASLWTRITCGLAIIDDTP
jgi:glucose dehydrogenase